MLIIDHDDVDKRKSMVFAARNLPDTHDAHACGFLKAFKNRWLGHNFIRIVAKSAVLSVAPAVHDLRRLAPSKGVRVAATDAADLCAFQASYQGRNWHNLNCTLTDLLWTLPLE